MDRVYFTDELFIQSLGLVVHLVRIIIRNILKLIVDTEVLEKILEENCEISWGSIADKFYIYSATDCKNNWDKILREFDLWEKGQLRKYLKIIRWYKEK